MSLTKLSPAGNSLIIPDRWEFGKRHPGWGRVNSSPLFYSVPLLCVFPTLCSTYMLPLLQTPNSWTYNFVEVSAHNIESSQNLRLPYIQCIHYKPVSKHFCSREGGGGGVKSVSRGDCEKQHLRLLSHDYVQEFGLREILRAKGLSSKKASQIIIIWLCVSFGRFHLCA